MLRNSSYVSYLSLLDDDIDYINSTDYYYSSEIVPEKNYSKHDHSGLHHQYKNIYWLNLFLVLSKFLLLV